MKGSVRSNLVRTLALLAGCGSSHVVSDAGLADIGPDASDGRTLVARLHATVNDNVDILFALDDSVGGVEQQSELENAFPAFELMLSGIAGGYPGFHLGVITSDLGTKGRDDTAPGPTIGTVGSGGCSGDGKRGDLQTNGTSSVSGAYISNQRNVDGSRSVNYSGTLQEAFNAIASVGGGGCGFEQPLEAVRRALTDNPANAGFLRHDAYLAVIMVSDEDDCSFTHSTLLGPDDGSLGPLQSFRCTRFGVQCDVGGTTPDDMNTVGAKSGCHSNETSPYLTSVDSYATFLRGLKADPSMIYFGAVVGPAEPFSVELRVPPSGGAAIPALAQSCSSVLAADPAVRIAQLGPELAYSSLGSICAPSGALDEAGRQIRIMMGDPCLSTALAMPLDCVVTETSGGVSSDVPPCGRGDATCWQLVTDAQACAVGSHDKFEIQRPSAPAPDTVDSIRCRR